MLFQLSAIAVRTSIVLVWLFVGVRLVGKKHVGEMNVYDLAMLMALSNAVQNAMTQGKGDLSVGLVSAGSLFAVGWIVTHLILRRPTIESRVVGVPTILVHNGHVQKEPMRLEQVTDEELKEALRSHGLASVSAAKLVVLEVDGEISVIPK